MSQSCYKVAVAPFILLALTVTQADALAAVSEATARHPSRQTSAFVPTSLLELQVQRAEESARSLFAFEQSQHLQPELPGRWPEANDNARLEALAEENLALRNELTRWRSAGSVVREKEARVVDLIKQTGLTQIGASTKVDVAPVQRSFVNEPDQSVTGGGALAQAQAQESWLPSLSANVTTGSSLLARSVTVARQYMAEDAFFAWRLILPIAVFVLFVAFMYVGSLQVKGAEMDAQYIQRSSIGERWSGALKHSMDGLLGARYKAIEFSELQVSGAVAGGDVCVALQKGKAKETKTKAREVQTPGALLRFPEKFVTHIKKQDDKDYVVLWIIDRHGVEDERVAKLEFAIPELIRLTHQVHGEYFQFELQSIAPSWASSGTCDPPRVAMRIRDVTNMPLPDAAR